MTTVTQKVKEIERYENGKSIILQPKFSPYTIKIACVFKDKIFDASSTFKVELGKIEIDTPKISKNSKNGSYKPYELPADAIINKTDKISPLTPVIAKIKVKSSKFTYLPAPDGIEIYFKSKSSAKNIHQFADAGIFLTPSRKQTEKSIIKRGEAKIIFQGSTVASDWGINSQNSKPKIVKRKAHSFILTASSSPKGKSLGKSKKITIVEGKATHIHFMNKKWKNKWHKSYNKKIKDIIGEKKIAKVTNENGRKTISINVKQKIKLGSIWPTEEVPSGRAVLFASLITDDFRNPIELGKNHKKDYRLIATAKLGWSANSIDGFFFSELNGSKIISADSKFEFYRKNNYPKGVLTGFWIPTTGGIQTKADRLTLTLLEKGKKKKIVKKKLSVKGGDIPNYGILSNWFLDNPDPEFSLAELGRSMIPFIGDGKDLLEYSYTKWRGGKTSVFDDIVAMLSIIGLISDIVTAVTLGIGAVFTIWIKGLVASSKMLIKALIKITVGLPTGFFKIFYKLITEFYNLVVKVGKGIPTDIKKIKKMTCNLITFVEKLFTVIKTTPKVTIRKWINILNSVIITTPLLLAFCTLLEKVTFEEAMDILHFLAYADKEKGITYNE